MRNLDQKLQSYIDSLLNVARPKLIAADGGVGSKLFNKVIAEYSQVAHHVFGALRCST